MKTRESVTVSKNFIGTILRIKDDSERAICYDTIFKALFTNEPVKMGNLPDIVQVAVSSLLPELRKIQTKYKNGCVQKNRERLKTGLLGSFDGSGKQAKLSEKPLARTSNISNNSIINNIYNVKNQSIYQSEKLEKARATYYTQVLEYHVDKIKLANDEVSSRLWNILIKLSKRTKPVTISGQELSASEIIKTIAGVFTLESGETVKILEKVFRKVDTIPEIQVIRNDFSYTVAMLYNETVGFSSPDFLEEPSQGILEDIAQNL